MKKSIRLIVLILSIFIVCFSFCGCDALDKLREKHAVWVNEGKTIVLLNGKEYMLLPYCEFLNPTCDNYHSIILTEKDVPLLLADVYGEYVSLSNDKAFICMDSLDTANALTKVYCVSDRYDEIKNQIEAGSVLNNYCYEYNGYNDETFEYTTGIYYFTKEEINAVSKVVDNNQTTKMDVYDGEMECVLEVYKCSPDGNFKDKIFDLVIYPTKAYLVYEDVENIPPESESATLEVPDELYATFRGIAKDYFKFVGYY
jgi:hypothetical protein